jgi:hypothetical protein
MMIKSYSVDIVYSYCMHSNLSMTASKHPLHLQVSQLDGEAPPPLPFIPIDIHERQEIDQKRKLNKTQGET